jgi:hypothetical protein
MNLLNVYVVLGYYDNAVKSNKNIDKRKVTGQEFNVKFANEQIEEILSYKQSALHWNNNLFEQRFATIFDNALKAYENISSSTKVEVHPQKSLLEYLKHIKEDYSKFKDLSSKASLGASLRELQTIHALEQLGDGDKAQFLIENYLGGVYYLTADEVIFEDGIYVIQESKNSSKGSLPSSSDVKDGLFKLILYANLHSLSLDSVQVPFKIRLKLTGKGVNGQIRFPCSQETFNTFLEKNKNIFTSTQKQLLKNLWSEVTENEKFELEVKGNS